MMPQKLFEIIFGGTFNAWSRQQVRCLSFRATAHVLKTSILVQVCLIRVGTKSSRTVALQIRYPCANIITQRLCLRRLTSDARTRSMELLFQASSLLLLCCSSAWRFLAAISTNLWAFFKNILSHWKKFYASKFLTVLLSMAHFTTCQKCTTKSITIYYTSSWIQLTLQLWICMPPRGRPGH